MTRIEIGEGEYELQLEDGLLVSVTRYGETWPAYSDGFFNKLEHAMAVRLEQAMVEIEQLQKKLEGLS